MANGHTPPLATSSPLSPHPHLKLFLFHLSVFFPAPTCDRKRGLKPRAEWVSERTARMKPSFDIHLPERREREREMARATNAECVLVLSSNALPRSLVAQRELPNSRPRLFFFQSFHDGRTLNQTQHFFHANLSDDEGLAFSLALSVNKAHVE